MHTSRMAEDVNLEEFLTTKDEFFGADIKAICTEVGLLPLQECRIKNYGAHYELMSAGIVGGPVKLIGNNNNTIDLSLSRWSRKVGLDGEKQMLPKKSPFTWYKACVGQATYSITIDEKTFCASQCNNLSSKRLAVQAICA